MYLPQCAVCNSLDKKLKDQSRALHSHLYAFYTIKALNRKLTILSDFVQPSYAGQERPSEDLLFKVAAHTHLLFLFMKFPTCSHYEKS